MKKKIPPNRQQFQLMLRGANLIIPSFQLQAKNKTKKRKRERGKRGGLVGMLSGKISLTINFCTAICGSWRLLLMYSWKLQDCCRIVRKHISVSSKAN